MLIILAVISMQAIFSDSGIIKQAEKAAAAQANAIKADEENMNILIDRIPNISSKKIPDILERYILGENKAGILATDILDISTYKFINNDIIPDADKSVKFIRMTNDAEHIYVTLEYDGEKYLGVGSVTTYQTQEIRKYKEQINEYGFYYETVYIVEIEGKYIKLYFFDDNTVLTIIDQSHGLKIWKISDGKIRIGTEEDYINIEIKDDGKLLLNNQIELLADINKEYSVEIEKDGQYGIYYSAVYVVENTEDLPNNLYGRPEILRSILTISSDYDFKTSTIHVGGIGSNGYGKEDMNNYQVLDDGRTIIKKSIYDEIAPITYKLLVDLYK